MGSLRLLSSLVLLALVTLSCDKLGLGGNPAAHAKNRVDFVLQTIRDHGAGTSRELQTAICRWEKDVVVIQDDSELGAASDAFDSWRQQAGIYPTLKSYELADEVRYAGEGDPENTFYVQANIDGTWRWIRVPHQARISWVQE